LRGEGVIRKRKERVVRETNKEDGLWDK